MEKKKLAESWIFKHTILFTVISILTFWHVFYYGKSFIHSHDGYLEIYNLLIYWGEYLRTFFSNLFIKHIFSLPSFDLNLGLGGNIYGNLNFYGVGDILNCLAAFFKPEHTEFLYTMLAFIRIYLAGIFFFIYCRHHKYQDKNILLGSVIYIFSYWTIQCATLHPYFLNPLLYFPLICLGMDFILEKNKPLLFVISCALAAYASVYFFYMMTILIFIYALTRYTFIYEKKEGAAHLFKKVAIAFAAYSIAIILALPVFIPFAKVILSGDRNGQALPLFYELFYYIKLPVAFVNATADHWTTMGYTILGLAAFLALFFKTKLKEKLELKIYAVLASLLIIFPLGGYIFNGFGYATNRWIWAFAFLLSIITIEFAPQFFSLSKKHTFVLFALACIFAVPTFITRSHGQSSFIAMIVLIALVFAIFAFIIFVMKNQKAAIYSIAIASIFLSSFSHYSPFFFNYIKQTEDRGEAFKDYSSCQYKILDENKIDIERQYRIDNAGPNVCSFNESKKIGINSGMSYKRSNTALYYSTNDNKVRQLLKDLRIPLNSELYYVGLNERAFVETFLACRYCSVKNGEEGYLPYGYDTKLASDSSRTIYENKNVLPLAFTYSDWMPIDNYKSLSAEQKQQAILQTAFIDANTKIEIPQRSQALEFSEKKLPYNYSSISENIEKNDKEFIAKQDGQSVDIAFDSCGAGEYYIKIDGFDYSNNLRQIWNSGHIHISHDGKTKTFEIRTSGDQMYSNLHNFIYNIGYIKNPEDAMKVTIAFSKKGKYSFDNIEVICQKVEKIPDYTAKLTADEISYHYENGKMRVKGNLGSNKILCVTAPFQDGSYAIVNGKKQKCFCVNNFATGIEIPKGAFETVIHF